MEYRYKLKENSISGGEQYQNPSSFKKKSSFKYKLKEVESEPSPRNFHNERMLAFDRINDLIGQIQPLLKDAKIETENHYKQNPLDFNVLYSTDIIIDYLEDIIKTLRPE